MRRAAVVPNGVTFAVAVTAASRLWSWAWAVWLLEELRAAGQRLTVAVISEALGALCLAQKLPEALALHRHAELPRCAPPRRPSEPGLLDLRELPVEVAKLAVRVALQDAASHAKPADLLIVTGRGHHSEGLGRRALLRPAVLQLLREELGLAPDAVAVAGNPGRLRVPAAAILRHAVARC